MNPEKISPTLPDEESAPDQQEKAMSDLTIEQVLEKLPVKEEEAQEVLDEIKNVEGSTWEERFDNIKTWLQEHVVHNATGIAFILLTAAYQFKPGSKMSPEEKKQRKDFESRIEYL